MNHIKISDATNVYRTIHLYETKFYPSFFTLT